MTQLAKEHHLNTSEFSNEQLDRFLFALMGRLKFHYDMSGNEIPKTKQQIADHLQCSIRQADKLVEIGVLIPRRTHDGADPRFFASEIKWK